MYWTSKKQIADARREVKRISLEAVATAKGFRTKARAQWAAHKMLIDRQSTRIARNKAHADESKAFQTWLRGQRDECQPVTKAIREKLAEIKASIDQSHEFIKSPQSYLQALNIGSEVRGRYHLELAGANRNMIAAMAMKARSYGDRDLAAALLAANDKLHKDSKAFDSVAFANEFVGDEVRALRAELDRIELVAESTELGLRKALGEEVSSLSVGMKARNYQPGDGIEEDKDFDQLPQIWRNINSEELSSSPFAEMRGGDSMKARDGIRKGLAARFGHGSDDEADAA
jgi:hypothetical protein